MPHPSRLRREAWDFGLSHAQTVEVLLRAEALALHRRQLLSRVYGEWGAGIFRVKIAEKIPTLAAQGWGSPTPSQAEACATRPSLVTFTDPSKSAWKEIRLL